MKKEVKNWETWHNGRIAILENNLDDSYDGGGNHITTTYSTRKVVWLKDCVAILDSRFIGLKSMQSMQSMQSMRTEY